MVPYLPSKKAKPSLLTAPRNLFKQLPNPGSTVQILSCIKFELQIRKSKSMKLYRTTVNGLPVRRVHGNCKGGKLSVTRIGTQFLQLPVDFPARFVALLLSARLRCPTREILVCRGEHTISHQTNERNERPNERRIDRWRRGGAFKGGR